jgi:hypothetical protein
MGLSALRKYATAATIDGVCLRTAGTAAIRANPTLASGDVKISLNGGAFANLATLPSAVPASGKNIEVALSSGETTCARALIIFSDATVPPEWDDFEIVVETFGNASSQFPPDYGDAVRLGLTALPNVASGSAGAVITSGTGTAQLSVGAGLVTLAGVTHTGAIIPVVSSIAAGGIATASFVAGAINAVVIAADTITAAKIADGAIDTATFAAGTTIPRVTLADTVTTYTGNTPQTGDAFARLGAPAGASVSADIATVKAKTDNLPVDPADASDIAGSFSTVNAALATIAGYIDTEIAAIKAKTDQITSFDFLTAGTRFLTMLETPGAGIYRYTAAALLNAPSGGGGGSGGTVTIVEQDSSIS